MKNNIPFNKPYATGKERTYILNALESGHISGNGIYTKKCQLFFQNKWKFNKCLLTTSCTDALEMCALLLDIKEGDEIIIPSFTFVSTALAFVRQKAKIVFCDSSNNHPNIDEEKIENLISIKTKAIVIVHYAGVACNMDKIMELSKKHNLFVVEDAAQAIDSYYTGEDGIKKPLGSIGHLGCFSFHETKNIQCGEGGILVINDKRFITRSEIIWEKGTNRADFSRGKVNKYEWVDVGSSFLPSDITAAFLYAQLENLDKVQQKRKAIWKKYYEELIHLEIEGLVNLPKIPDYATNNSHMFYLICRNNTERSKLISHLESNGIMAVFHYLSLHKSSFYKNTHGNRELQNSDYFTNCLVRIPLYYEISEYQLAKVIQSIKLFYTKKPK